MGWALTWNVDWDETNNQWTRRDISNRTMFFRINGNDHSFEYGNDYRPSFEPPVMETLFRVSPEGEIWAKSQGGQYGVTLEMTNNVRIDGKPVRLAFGQVVVLDPSRPFSVIAPRKYADENPVVVHGVDRDDSSRVFVLIGGRSHPRTPYVDRDIGIKIKAGDLLVTQGKDSLLAVAARGEVDPRAVIGRVQNKYMGFYTIVP